jgi:polyhydroxyalkanoate synthesis repressor PhaR
MVSRPGQAALDVADQGTDGVVGMSKSSEPVVIKKYANRRLYNTGTSTYVTLEDLASLVKREEDFVVYDAKTGEDITRPVLTQIIVEQENKGENLLPTTFLRQLIRFYDDSLRSVIPSYLEYSINMFTREQERFRQQMADAFGGKAFQAMEEQVRQNMAMFDKAMRLFNPFARAGAATGEANPGTAGQAERGELEALKRQVEEMQRRLDRMSSGEP